MEWSGVVGVVWCGVVWSGVVWCGEVGVVWSGVVGCGVVGCGQCGLVWCGVVWCGVVSVVWCVSYLQGWNSHTVGHIWLVGLQQCDERQELVSTALAFICPCQESGTVVKTHTVDVYEICNIHVDVRGGFEGLIYQAGSPPGQEHVEPLGHWQKHWWDGSPHPAYSVCERSATHQLKHLA